MHTTIESQLQREANAMLPAEHSVTIRSATPEEERDKFRYVVEPRNYSGYAPFHNAQEVRRFLRDHAAKLS